MSPSNDEPGGERRQYRRVAAPMYCRPARRRLLRRRKVLDLGLGGMRVYSDEPFDVGKRMDVDLLMATGDDFITCLTEVVWIRELPGSTPARFDVGLRFLDIPARARSMIQALMDGATDREHNDR